MTDSRNVHTSSPLRRGLVTAASVLLVTAGMAFAQPRATAPADAPRVQAPRAQAQRMDGARAGRVGVRSMDPAQGRAPGRAHHQVTHRVARGAGAPIGLAGLHGLPTGTEVTVTTYGAEPAEGAGPLAVLTLTVGEDSEAAFSRELADALQDAAFVQIAHGERTVALDVADGLAFGVGRGGRTGLPCFACLDDGQTVQVDVYQDAGDTEPVATFSFTQGEDSAIGFREAVQDAAADAARVEATLPATERTIDLTARAERPYGPGASPRGWRW